MFADQQPHSTYSQQVNTLALLAGLVPVSARAHVADALVSDSHLTQSTIYFAAYTQAALRDSGMGDSYIGRLTPWREMLDQGLTTWSEWTSDDTRSDCHAWSASPNFELFRSLAGIESAATGFRKVRVAPHLGDLKWVNATVPHPRGEITVSFHAESGSLQADVELPDGITGELNWGGGAQELHPGKNHLTMAEKSNHPSH